MKKALIAMSGGVDSSACALIMKNAGYECIGATMRLVPEENEGACGAGKDADDAKMVADFLGMKHYTLDLRNEFMDKVIMNFITDYEKGKTPNPCVECNKYMKFGYLLDFAKEQGCDVLVTGHYARVEKSENRFLLKKAPDTAKDQSYFLYSLTQEQLSMVQFPLGEMSKEEVRSIAEKNGLICAKKKDSQDICFVPEGDYASVIKKHRNLNNPQGDFVDLDGNILGKHKGIINYTIGQRKGIGLALPRPMYVKEKDIKDNKIVLSTDEQLFDIELKAKDFNWISISEPEAPIRALVKVRYRHKEAPATIFVIESGNVKIVFDEPQRAIAPGQSVVLYDGDTVIGGGKII